MHATGSIDCMRSVSRPRSSDAVNHAVLVGGVRFAHRKFLKLGHRVTFAERPDEFRPGDETLGSRLLLVDCHHPTLLRDMLLAIHSHDPIAGIVSYTEFEQEAVWYSSEALALPRTSLRAIQCTRDKGRMREELERAQLSPIAYRLGSDFGDIEQFANSNGFPLILKPRSDMGSRGILSIRDASEMLLARAWAADRTAFLVEELLAGAEISAETFTINGHHVHLTLTDKITTGPPHFVELGHTVPSGVSPTVAATVWSLVDNFLTLVDHHFGPAHTELRLTDRGPRIIESHVRPGGDCIVDLMEFAFGYDVYMLYAGALIGETTLRPADFAPTERGHGAAAIRYLTPPPGRIVSLDGFTDLERQPGWVRTYDPYVVGGTVSPILNSGSRGGWVMAIGSTHAEVMNRAERLRALPHVTVDKSGISNETAL